MLYIIKQTRHNRFKIGISKDPRKRINKLEKVWGEFDDVKLFSTTNDLRKEQSLHNVFEGYQIHNLQGDGHTEFFSTDCYDQVVTILTETPKEYVQDIRISKWSIFVSFVTKSLKWLFFSLVALLGIAYFLGK